MNLKFYRCDTCRRLDEYRELMFRTHCTCGSRKIRPVLASNFALIMFILLHPSYLIGALRGEK